MQEFGGSWCTWWSVCDGCANNLILCYQLLTGLVCMWFLKFSECKNLDGKAETRENKLGLCCSSCFDWCAHHNYLVQVLNVVSLRQGHYTTKTQKYFICFFCLFTSGHLLYASKNKKEQKHFRFLESNTKTEV